MSADSNLVMAVAITRDEARVWTSTNEAGTETEEVRAPSESQRHHHRRPTQDAHGHGAGPDTLAYFESITSALHGASEIILVGHGRGRANEMVALMQYWGRKHPDVARKVVGAVDSDLEALSDNQVLALVREWYREHREFI